MTITWLKLHNDILGDIKLRKFTPQEKWAWIALLILANQSSNRGYISADDEDIADACEFNTPQDWLYYRDKLIAKGMLEHSEKGLKVLNWEARQYIFPSDKPAATKERKRNSRAKQKMMGSAKKKTVTSGHENVTSESRVVTPRLDQIRSDTDLDQIRSDTDLLNPIVSFADASDLCEGKESGTETSGPESQESTPLPIADSSITVPSSEGSAEIVVPAAKSYPSRKRKSKAVPQRYPEECQKLWDLYKQCCYDVSDATNIVAHGDWGTFVAVWDDVVTAVELPQIVEATEYYCMAKRMQYAGKGQAIGIPHCWRYLRDRKWVEALEYKRKKESSGGGVTAFVSKGDLANAQRRASIRDALAEFATPGGEDRGYRTIDV